MTISLFVQNPKNFNIKKK